jgi:DNA-binding NarL/FixJ family response regulator
MTIMIVDDNTSMRRMVRQYLAGLFPAMEFVECGAGEDALSSYRVSLPDLTIMDIKMGQMDGIAATRAIRSAFPDARVVILTQYDDPDLRLEASNVGAVGYCLKDNLTDIGVFLSSQQ